MTHNTPHLRYRECQVHETEMELAKFSILTSLCLVVVSSLGDNTALVLRAKRERRLPWRNETPREV